MLDVKDLHPIGIGTWTISKAFIRLFPKVICDLYLSGFSFASKVIIVSRNLCNVESICLFASIKSSLVYSIITLHSF